MKGPVMLIIVKEEGLVIEGFTLGRLGETLCDVTPLSYSVIAPSPLPHPTLPHYPDCSVLITGKANTGFPSTHVSCHLLEFTCLDSAYTERSFA